MDSLETALISTVSMLVAFLAAMVLMELRGLMRTGVTLVRHLIGRVAWHVRERLYRLALRRAWRTLQRAPPTYTASEAESKKSIECITKE